MRHRNGFGRRLPQSLVKEYGGDPRVAYRLAMTIVPMGDHNAVDLAQAVHLQVLRDGGAMQEEDLVEWGRPMPLGPIFEGLYIDDHVVAAIVGRDNMGENHGRDREIIEASHAAYERAGLPRSPEKSFGFGKTSDTRRKGDGVFTAWGTRARSEEGTAGVPQEKRALLVSAAVQLLEGRLGEKSILQRLTALFSFPLIHRRELMCL